MTAMNCMPVGCQCGCHNPPPGIEIKHLVPCCNPADELTAETERLGLYDNLHIPTFRAAVSGEAQKTGTEGRR